MPVLIIASQYPGRLVHNCGYGGSVGAMKAMGALDMGMQEEELKPLVDAWRTANPKIVEFWWEVDEAIKECVRSKGENSVRNIGFRYQSGMLFIDLPSGRSLVYVKPRIEENDFGGESVRSKGENSVRNIGFRYQSGMLFIDLPSGRSLVYVKPRIEENDFGGESITYMGVGANKKWELIESYGPKFVENIVQAVARDLLMEGMLRMRKYGIVAHVHDEVIIEADADDSVDKVCRLMSVVPVWADGLMEGMLRMRKYGIVAHVHDEVIIEADADDSVDKVCRLMSVVPVWADGLVLNADGYECSFYMKD